MAEPQPEVLADMLMFNALDYDRDEIAQMVNDRHGTDHSARYVGDKINAVEKEAEESGNPRYVFLKYLARGYSVLFGMDLAYEVAQAAKDVISR